MAGILFTETGKWPTTDEGWCEYFKALDEKFNTPHDEVPLGHDHRCPLCKKESIVDSKR